MQETQYSRRKRLGFCVSCRKKRNTIKVYCKPCVYKRKELAKEKRQTNKFRKNENTSLTLEQFELLKKYNKYVFTEKL